MASCKTYGHKALVNSGRLSEDRLHDVIGLEFSSLIKSDLTWKNVAKGSRSSSRRARSSVSVNWSAGEAVERKDSNNVDISFSESEKLGVCVLGCHFSENADHVPIKKRKLTLRSLSPSPKAHLQQIKANRGFLKCRPEAVDYTSCTSNLDHIGDTEVMKHDVDEKNLEIAHEQVNDKEDFSGILILAAAACSDSFREDCVHEGHSMRNKLQTLSSRVSEEDFCSAETLAQGTGSATVNVKETDEMRGVSSHDNRSYWDLNTSMDAWPCPIEDSSRIMDGIPKDVKCGNSSDNHGSSESETIQGEPESNICHTESRLPPADPGGMGHKERFIETKECKSDSCTDIDRTSCSQEKLASGYVNFVPTESVTPSTNTEKHNAAQCLTSSSTGNSKSSSSHQVTGSNSSAHASLPSESNQTLRTYMSKAVCDAASTSSTGVTSTKKEDGCAASICTTVTSDMKVDEAELAPHLSCSVNTTSDTQDVLNEDIQEAKENSVCQSTERLRSPNTVQIPTLHMISLDLKVQCDDAIEHDDTEACKNNTKDIPSSRDEMAVKEPSGGGYNSEVFHDVHAYVKASRSEVDYDSQYEDGELRESVEHPWQEYDGDDLEVEQVDYGSDSDNLASPSEEAATCIRGVDLQTHSSWLKGKDAESVVKTGDVIYHKVTDNDIANGRIGAGMDDRMNGGRNCPGHRNINSEVADRVDSMDQTRMAESRTCRRETSSRMEEQKFNENSFRKDRGRCARYYYSGVRRVDCLVDPRDGSGAIKQYRSPTSMSDRHLGPAKGPHHVLTRSGSPDARDDDLGQQMPIRSSRKPSSDWHVTLRRGRSVRYGLPITGRGTSSRHHGLVADYNDSSLPYSHRFTKGDRSFSPIKRREPQVHRSHSRSSSRSRSHSSSSRNQGYRCQSKSPNFRSSIRMQRRRSPCQRPHLFVDHAGGFKSAPRCHGSPHGNARWIDDRKNGACQFREQSYSKHSSFLFRRGRFAERDHRFDFSDSPRTFKSMHPRRFVDMDRAVVGGLRHEESDYDRGKHHYRSRLDHRIKRYDVDEPVKRRRYNVEDGYSSRSRDIPELRGRGSLRAHGMDLDGEISDMPRKYRENRGHFGYRREGKYNVDGKSYGVQEGGDEMP